jgi:hypothetical protein
MIESPEGTLLRLAAFTTDPSGGNPAGVWIGAALPAETEMQRIAAEVGYSETEFLARDGSDLPGRFRVRYFSPLAEVPFCAHATIASGVALAERRLAAPAARPGDPAETRGARQVSRARPLPGRRRGRGPGIRNAPLVRCRCKVPGVDRDTGATPP